MTSLNHLFLCPSGERLSPLHEPILCIILIASTFLITHVKITSSIRTLRKQTEYSILIMLTHQKSILYINKLQLYTYRNSDPKDIKVNNSE